MKKYLFIVSLWMVSSSMIGQVDKSSKLYKTLQVNDSIIFNASFNTCNLEELALLINDDFEFYHDKSGLLEGKEAFIENTKNGLCKSTASLRRVLEKGTLDVFPLNDSDGKLYAAIQKGIHGFYENDRKGSIAKFTHLWILKNDTWKLKRVLSYDHKGVTEKVGTDQKMITISTNVLMQYAGQYEAPKTGKVNIFMKNNSLALRTSTDQMIIFPKSNSVFFNTEQPLTFEFIKDAKGIVTKMKIFENNNVVEEAIKIK